MFADIFIHRPRLAMVIAIIITLAGTIALLNIPVAQYPDITPPTVQVSASYPGADAQTLAETVAAPIEQQVNGVEGMIYMASTTSSSGLYTLTVTFAVGTDPDIAQVNVQNRVALATPQLPDAVTQARRQRARAAAELPADRQHLLAERHARRAVPVELRADQRGQSRSRASPASARPT